MTDLTLALGGVAFFVLSQGLCWFLVKTGR